MVVARLFLVIAILALGWLQEPASAQAEAHITPESPSVPLTLFYHPPKDSTALDVVAKQFHSAIFTRGDERYRDQLRAAGFAGPILQYLVANEASGPGGLKDSRDACGAYLTSGNDVSGIARDFCQALHPHEDVFLHNGAGERLYSTLSWEEQSGTKTRYYYLMNPSSPRWVDYFVSHASINARQLGYNGLFIDNLDRSLERGLHRSSNSDGQVAEYVSDEHYREAVLNGLQSLREILGSIPIWGNVTTAYFRPLDGELFTPMLDAVMNEYFVGLWRGRLPLPAHWELQLQQAERIIYDRKTFVAVAQGERNNVPRLRFALASFLLVANQQSFFRYTDDATYEQAWLYDDYRAALGKPLGRRYQSGHEWHRDYQCGRVTVDPVKHQGSIETTGGCAAGQ